MQTNQKQQEVINTIDGISIIDAGAGTGKTHTITQRYINLLNHRINPENILLITFTRNAATQMKEKVISKVDSNKKSDIVDAPIMNFDSFCSKIVSNNGMNSPNLLGIKETLTGYKVISESVIQKRIFNKFFNQFLEQYEKQYLQLLTSISDPLQLLSVIEKLLSKGMYPTKNGWLFNADEKLKGNYEEFMKICEEINQTDGKSESKLLKEFKNGIREKQFIHSPENIENEKQLNPELLEEAFNDNRKDLENFIHHVFIEYIEFMIRENTMTFSLIAMFAFITLYFEDEIREANSFDYITVDEFQDTNEMQFMLILLLLKKPNLCVVGDWKQGIYGFRNATISNIRDFERKINEYKQELNREKITIPFKIPSINILEFDISYRSSQKVLNFSEKSLCVNGKDKELNEEKIQEIQKNIVSLKSNFDYDDSSHINHYQAIDKDTEINFILQKIQQLVGKKKIPYYDFNEEKYKYRYVDFNDIAILSRNRTFGVDIQKRASHYNIPVVYEGGIKLFEQVEAIVLLGWLKLLLNIDKKDAWITILEKENYSYAQINDILKNKKYPKEILEFRNHLLNNKKVIHYVIDEIMNRYDFFGSISNALISILDQLFHSTLISISELIVFIEDNIENGETYNVEIESGDNSVTIQTIHGAKGLEYPIVFVVNCNSSTFPSNQGEKNSLIFNELVGLRNKKFYSPEYEFVFDSWRTNLVSKCLNSDMDEERRLLYVAITRAMYDVYITSHRPSHFFKGLSEDAYEVIEGTSIEKLPFGSVKEHSQLSIKTSLDSNNVILGVHDLMNFREGQKGRGKEFGNQIHRLAFKYSNGFSIKEFNDKYVEDFSNVKSYIDTLRNGKLIPEIDCSLPVGSTMIRGIIDLIVEYDDLVEIIDWKTDIEKDNFKEYQKQLSIYYYVVKENYPDKEIKCSIYWTYYGENERIEVLDWSKIVDSVEKVLQSH